MTPEERKLINQLLLIGDVTIFNRKKETIVKAIEEMDMESLRLILDENLTYQDATKEMFLSKLEEIFDEFKISNDTLQSHSGKCGSKDCSNHNKNGMLFCGRNSGNHFNLIIEEDENENVKDLYYCNVFKCNFEDRVNKNGQSLELFIYEDEKAKFRPSPHFEYLNRKSIEAIFELSIFKDKTISKAELFNWHEKYSDFYVSKTLLDYRFKNEHRFYQVYRKAEEIKKYLELENECAKAMQLYDTLIENNEMNLLKWLAEHEHLKDELILFYCDLADEKTGDLSKVILNKELNISLELEYLINCIRFQDIIDTHYYGMFNKFKVDIGKIKDGTRIGDDIEKHISLNYHLKQRNLFVENISYKIKLGKNSYLYGSDDFGILD